VSDRVEIKTPEWTATLIKRSNGHDERKRYYSATRVYDAEITFAPREVQAYNDAIVADPDTDHRALLRALTTQARVGLLDALNALVPRLDVNFRDWTTGLVLPSVGTFKIKFSRKAGCSCGCSPGFIVDGDTLRVDGEPVDVWFSVTKPEPKSTPEITKKDLAQAVFHSLVVLDQIKQELGV